MNNLVLIKPNTSDQYYKTINLSSLLDVTLSFKAKGLHNYIMTRPDNWVLKMKHLFHVSSDGEASVRSAIKELVDKKYLHMMTIKDKKNKIKQWVYIACQSPTDLTTGDVNQIINKNFPDCDFPDVEIPDVENQVYSKKNISNNIISNNIYSDLLHLWNSQKIIVHKKISPLMEKSINKIIKIYSVHEITQAIKNYGEIIAHPEIYFFTFRWPLADFLTEKRIGNFLDEAEPKQRYKKNPSRTSTRTICPQREQYPLDLEVTQ